MSINHNSGFVSFRLSIYLRSTSYSVTGNPKLNLYLPSQAAQAARPRIRVDCGQLLSPSNKSRIQETNRENMGNPHKSVRYQFEPGTRNIHFKMVVSVRWLQIITWKMVLSPNIHLKVVVLGTKFWDFLWIISLQTRCFGRQKLRKVAACWGKKSSNVCEVGDQQKTKNEEKLHKKHGNKWKKHEKTSHTHKPTPIFIRYPPPETSPSFGFNSTHFKKATILQRSYSTYLKRNTALFCWKPLEVRFVGVLTGYMLRHRQKDELLQQA